MSNEGLIIKKNNNKFKEYYCVREEKYVDALKILNMWLNQRNRWRKASLSFIVILF